MSAPVKNKFWQLRSRHGRDKLFANPDLLWKAACEYFAWCEENPLIAIEQSKAQPKPYKDSDGKIHWPPNTVELPKMRPFTLQGLCGYLRCNTAYFRTFKSSRRVDAEGFDTVITCIEDVIYNQKFSGAAAGFLNANIIARDLGLAEKSSTSHTVYDNLSDEDLDRIINELKNTQTDEK